MGPSRLGVFGRAVASLRVAFGLTQVQLAERIGRSQSYVSLLERGRLPGLSVVDAERICRPLGATLVFGIEAPPALIGSRQVDAVHARCVAYVGRRLVGAGWIVQREVEVGGPGRPGWVDVLAYHPRGRILLVIEVKTELRDVGDVERQLGWYERRAMAAAHAFGWLPTRTAGCLLLLATDQNDRRIQENGAALGFTFPIRYRGMQALVDDGVVPPAPARGLALIDLAPESGAGVGHRSRRGGDRRLHICTTPISSSRTP